VAASAAGLADEIGYSGVTMGLLADRLGVRPPSLYKHVGGSIAAVLRGYGIGEDEMNHAIRTIRSTMHGFAMLEASRGFQWDADPDESFDWMIDFIDRGLRGPLPG
jgi:AcrR family transcriptional regulator